MPSKAAATAAPAAAAATATPARRMVTGEDDLGSIGDGHPVLVLSVDDDPVNQLVIQSWLAPKGYEVGRVCTHTHTHTHTARAPLPHAGLYQGRWYLLARA